MKILNWYKNRPVIIKIIIISLSLFLVAYILIFLYLFTYQYFSKIYYICEKDISVGMSREEAKLIIHPLVENSFINYGFNDTENDLYLMDNRGVYCEVKIQDDKVLDYWWGIDAP